MIEKHPELARDGIELRKFGQQVIEGLAKERVHPSWTVPGGVNAPLDLPSARPHPGRAAAAKAIAERTIAFFKGAVDKFKEEIADFGTAPTMYAGLVDAQGQPAALRRRACASATPRATIVKDRIRAAGYQQLHRRGDASESYLKAPYYKPLGYPQGVYRVGPLARLNAADRCGTPKADVELAEFRQRFGKPAQSSFLFHYARLIEMLYALERMETLLNDPEILDQHVRATAGVNSLEGVGIVEAPRGMLIHHYKVNEDGRDHLGQPHRRHRPQQPRHRPQHPAGQPHFIDGNKLQEGMLNRVSAVVRAYDPCFSCSTHADGQYPLDVQLVNAAGAVVDRRRS